MTSKIFKIAAMTLMAATALAMTASEASARSFTRSGSFTGAYGRGFTHSASVNRSPGSVSGTRSLQTNAGYGGTRSFERGCSGGICSARSTTTTNSGRTWSRSGSVSAPGNGTANWDRTATGPNGGSVSRSGSCTAGTGCARDTTVTGPNGNSWTADRSAYANGYGALDRTATITGPEGGSASRSVDTYRYPGVTARTVTTTGPNGGEINRGWVDFY
jgi:hypothetical protein